MKVGSFRTRLFELGAPDDPPVVLIHDGAWGADAEASWGDVMTTLGTRNRVIAPDLLGYGGTDKAVFLDRSPYDVRVEHIGGLLELLDVREPAHFVGCSVGGSVVLRALEAGKRAWQVRSAVSIGGTGGPWRKSEPKEVLARFDGTSEYLRKVVALLADEDSEEFERNLALRYRNTQMPGHYEAAAALRLEHPLAAGADNVSDRYPKTLRGSGVPILLVRGRRDSLLEADWTDRLRTSIRDQVEVAEVDGRHAPNIDHADEVVEVLSDWFRRH